MDELEAIRQKKLQDLQEQAYAQAQEQSEVESQVQQLEAVVKKALTREALVRYSTLKSAHPELALKLMAIIYQLLQRGSVQSINEDQLIEIIKEIQPKRHDIKITRK